MYLFNQKTILGLLAALLVFTAGCKNTGKSDKQEVKTAVHLKGSFGYDLDFLKMHQESLVLKRNDAMILIANDYQGRVMTSTATGLDGKSYGWLNYWLIESGENAAHFNNYGGEERFWLGPEGGQFSIYFSPGAEFIFDNWQVPAPIDSEPFELIMSNDTLAAFRHDMRLKNYSGFDFMLRVDRSVELLSKKQIPGEIGINIPDELSLVGYKSVNKVTNTGKISWSKETGLLSIWVLGQLISSPTNTVIVPYIQGPTDKLGLEVNDNYFGKVPANRLKVKDGIIYFKADGIQRGKIGLSPLRAKNYLGSYDSEEGVLTLVYYNKPEQHEGYVNSMWEIQKQPFDGDVINSYNDGPLDDGSQLGPFYELETSSAAAVLKPGDSFEHICTTIHISGNEVLLNQVIKSAFGIQISDIKSAFSE